MSNKQHKMIAGGHGHGLSHCEYCLASDREIAFALGPVCPRAPETPATDAGGLVEQLVGIADACRRDDGSDIPLGKQIREAATAITTLQGMLAGQERVSDTVHAALQKADAKAQADAAEIERLRSAWLIGQQVQVAAHCPDAELWNRDKLFIVGIRTMPHCKALNIEIAEEYPRTQLGTTDGFMVCRAHGPDDLIRVTALGEQP